MNNLVMSHAMPSSTSTDSAIPDTTSPASAPATLEWLVANDGHRIPLRHWPVASPRAVIHIVHGMAEHSGSYADTASALNAAGYAVLAHDHRCHGLATVMDQLGDVGPQQHWDGVCHDMATVNADIHHRYPELPLILIGHSMGSFISQYFAQHFPDQINLLLLEGSTYEAPWFSTAGSLLGDFECWRLGVNGRSPLIHALSFGAFNKAFKKPRTDFDWLSRCHKFVDGYIADPLCGFQLSNGYWRDFTRGLADLYRPHSLKRIRSDLPIYVFSGDKDPVGHNGRGAEKLAIALRDISGCRDVTLRLYPEARHDLLHETNSDEVLTDLLGWIKRHLSS